MNTDNFIAKNHCLKDIPYKPKSFIFKIRNYIFQKYDIWDFLDLFPYRWRMYYYDKIKPIFKPQNERIRKSIPRTWTDVSHLIVEVNFEFIKAFYEDEYKADIVDWDATEQHKEFAKWLEESYEYITKIRPHLEINLQNAYPQHKNFYNLFEEIVDENGKRMFQMVDDGVPYEVKYKDVIRIENEIENNDTEILTQIIKRRSYFWT
jgi:hypothetical protein